ncbi:MAG: mechanosensitive ion channel [Oligoflexia bacterium]|nr:mechanosensitive ion channel [Oligoflexia bacterium]
MGLFHLWTDLSVLAKNFWSYDIKVVDGDAITPGKIILAVLLLSLGITVSRWFSGALERRLLTRLRVPIGGRAAIRALTQYSLSICFALLALHLVNIPLTVFTFIGGALAIGIGFGSQNLVNNFISGLIVLVEQPIRVGDLIEMQNAQGRVVKIGARSTIIRTNTNTDAIVPNSAFLEKDLINWTLSDDVIRCNIAVGVAYGSDTRLVAQLLQEACSGNAKTVAKPAPLVLFSDFGDSSLKFDLYFWIRTEGLMDRRILESEIRFKIEQIFREKGVEISFPHRDLHLSSRAPLEIKMVGGS